MNCLAKTILRRVYLPFLLGYKAQLLFPSKAIPKNLDPSYKINLDLGDCLGRVKIILKQNFIGLFKLHNRSREAKTPSYSQINMVVEKKKKSSQNYPKIRL